MASLDAVWAQCNTAPSALSATALTSSTAFILWTTGGASNWNIEYGPVGFTQGNGTYFSSSDSSATLSSLTTNLAYEFYVRDSCGAGSVSAWTGPEPVNATVTNCDNMDIYSTGLIENQSTLLYGWFGGGGDGEISTEYANSGSNSLKIYSSGSSGSSDIVAEMSTYSSGIHVVKFDFYIPSGFGGYYNILHNYVGSGTNVWAIETYLDSSGVATVEEGSNGTADIGTYNFNMGAWNTVEHIINLDDDTAFIKINGNFTDVGWQFSLGSANFGDQFNAVNFYSTAPAGQTPLVYFDNFCVTDAPVDDIGMVEFIATPPICGDSFYGITAVVENYAYNNPAGFDIEVDISGSLSTSFTHTYQGALFPGVKDTIILGTVNTLSGGTYNIESYSDLSGDNDLTNDSIAVSGVIILPGVYFDFGPDTSYCDNAPLALTLDAENTGASFDWSTGATTQSITADTAGTYWVEVTNSSNCSYVDSIVIEELEAPSVNLGPDYSYCDNSSIYILLNAGNFGASYNWSTGETVQFVPVDTAGVYWVDVISSSNGCVDKDTVTVTELVSPVVNIDDVTICGGDTAMLDAGNAGSTYEWSVTGETDQILEIAEAGLFTVTVTAANGCEDTGSVEVMVNVSPLVTLGSDTIISEGSTLTLNAGNAGSTYSWSTGATSQTINVTEAGTYTVTVTNSDGCDAEDEIFVDVAVGVQDLVSGPLHLYPNPMKGSAVIDLNLVKGGNLHMTLYTLDGRAVWTANQSVSGGQQSIPVNIQALNSGLYLLDVKLDDRTLSTLRLSKL